MSPYKEREDNEGCCQSFKDEFKARNLLLDYKYPGLFHRAKLANGPSIVYLIWRVFWVVYHISLIGLSGHLNKFYATSEFNRRKWPLFMTNWALSSLTISTILDMIGSFYFYFNKKELLRGEDGTMPWYVKMFWVVMNTANAMGFVVGVSWWAFLYDYSLGIAGYRILPFLTHGVNMMYITVNLFVTAMPVRFLHFLHPAIFITVYLIVNAIYVVAGGTNDVDEPYIYPIMDWNQKPGISVAFAIAAVVGACLAHMLVYVLHLIRNCICKCSSSDRNVVV